MRWPGSRMGRVASGASSLCVREQPRMVCDRRRVRAGMCLGDDVRGSLCRCGLLWRVL